MSRVIIKNLPKTTTDEEIRKLFSQKGTVTDVQLKYTPDGKFRQFAFVGYQLENEAGDAIKFFDKMFIKTNKITVESCTLLGDKSKPKAWSKYATDSSAYKKSNPSAHAGEDKPDNENDGPEHDDTLHLLESYKDEPMFEEFLQVHAPEESQKLSLSKVKSKDIYKDANTKVNEDDTVDSNCEEESDEVAKPADKLAEQNMSDLDYMKQLMKKKVKAEKKPKDIVLFTAKLKGLPYKVKKKDIKDFFKPVTPFSIRIPTKVHGFAYVGFKLEKDFKKALLKDRSFMSGKRIFVVKYSVNDQDETDNAGNKTKFRSDKWKSQEETLKFEESIGESGKIFIRNLAYTTKEEEIEEKFSKYGPLAEVSLPVDPTSKKIKGFGTITFVMPENAVLAYNELDGSILHGRMLHLLPGKTKDNVEDEPLEEMSNYKKKKAGMQKTQAGSSHNWNSLFLGHDAVAEVIADTYNTSKETVLDPHGDGSAAVRLALGETQIVAQTRKYLEQEGVVLDAFNSRSSKRSKTVILVKNLPSKTEVREIRKLFEPFGTLGRVILPPSGITALVEFLEPSEAKKSFTRLAYSKFKNVPLYLEWAPENTLKENHTPQQAAVDTEETKNDEQNEIVATNNQNEVEESDEEPEDVKNLNFKTTNESLKKHFEGCGKIFYATITTKKDPSNPSNTLSMGYGFVRFYYKSAADKALKTLQQSVLDGKSLELKRSERTLTNDVKTGRKTQKKTDQTGTKILVRNVPFQASIKEIRELFTTFGEIKALRLPKKMTLDAGSHRGFAFVDYTTESDAKKAFEALSQSTHLYGRRLVLEWAAQKEGVEEIRKRTADHFKPSEDVKSKKSVFNLDE